MVFIRWVLWGLCFITIHELFIIMPQLSSVRSQHMHLFFLEFLIVFLFSYEIKLKLSLLTSSKTHNSFEMVTKWKLWPSFSASNDIHVIANSSWKASLIGRHILILELSIMEEWCLQVHGILSLLCSLVINVYPGISFHFLLGCFYYSLHSLSSSFFFTFTLLEYILK